MRKQRLLAKLEPHFVESSVIALQELPTDWYCWLRVWLRSEKDYDIVFHPYGTSRDGYWGVAIAVPLSKYSIEQVSEFCVATESNMINPPTQSSWTIADFFHRCLWLLSVFVYLTSFSLLRWKPEAPTDPYSTYRVAQRRWNFVVAVKLRPNDCNGGPFWVSTYHMPCAFWAPYVMFRHASSYVQMVQDLAGDTPFVITGDFNIKPVDGVYRMLASCSWDEFEDVAHCQPSEDPWTPHFPTPIRSACVVANGSEPAWTNNCHHPRSNTRFKETLDYIWISPEWHVAEAGVDCPPGTEICPNLNEPSDHVPVFAELLL